MNFTKILELGVWNWPEEKCSNCGELGGIIAPGPKELTSYDRPDSMDEADELKIGPLGHVVCCTKCYAVMVSTGGAPRVVFTDWPE